MSAHHVQGRLVLNRLGRSGGAVALTVAVVLVPATPAVAAGGGDCAAYTLDMVPETSQVASTPHELLGISQAHALFEGAGDEPGEGVTVAVIDNGVTTGSGLLSVTRTEPYPIAGQSEARRRARFRGGGADRRARPRTGRSDRDRARCHDHRRPRLRQ